MTIYRFDDDNPNSPGDRVAHAVFVISHIGTANLKSIARPTMQDDFTIELFEPVDAATADHIAIAEIV